MKPLFEKRNREYLGPGSHCENTYSYFDRSARKDIARIRYILNKWFSKYPKNEKEELKVRFKESFSSAFFELFIHELFRRQRFKITVHPTLPNSTKRPDFLIKKYKFEAYVEVKESRGKSKVEESQNNRINQFYDSINNAKNLRFFLCIDDLDFKSSLQPNTNKILRFLEQETDSLDPEKVSEQINKSGFDSSPHVIYEDADIKVIFSLIPKSSEAQKSIDTRAIGIYPMETILGGSEESIKTSISKKAKKYGHLDKPLIICINANGNIGDLSFDVENAVWGTLVLSYSSDPKNPNEKLARLNDGIFRDSKGPINKRVSGVLITKVMSFNFPSAQFWFIKHPYASKEIDFDFFKLSYFCIKENKITKVEKKNFGEILKVKQDYLKIN